MELTNVEKRYVVHRCLSCYGKFAVEMLKCGDELMYAETSKLGCPKCRTGTVNGYSHPPIEQFEKYYRKIWGDKPLPEFNDLIRCEYCGTENYELNIKCRACGAPIKHMVAEKRDES